MPALFLLVSSFCFTTMAVLVKLGANDFGAIELIFYRSVVGLVILYGVIRSKNYSLRTPYFWGHIKRSVAGFVGIATWFMSLGMVNVSTSMTLSSTTPLFVGAMASIVALTRKQPLQWPLLLAIVIGFFGVTLILQPSMEGENQLLGCALALCCGLLSGVAYWQIKELGELGEPSWRIVFYFTLFGTVFGALGAFVFEGGFSPVRLDNVGYLIGIALMAIIAQLSLTNAFGKGNVLLMSCLTYSSIVFAELYAIFLFDDSADWGTLAGMGLIIAAGVSSSMLTKKKAKSG